MKDSKSLRIVYMGTPDFAVEPLKALVENGYKVVGVITAPDKPAGRGLKVQQSAVKKYAESVDLRILQPVKLKDETFVNEFRSLDADLGIVIAFRMLPEIIWNAPKMGTFNLHASLLPNYRGAAPINWAVINGETETGVTTFMLNAEIDKGDVLCRTVVPIGPDETAGSLHDELMHTGTRLVIETVEKLASGDVQPIPQLETADLKPAPKIFKDTCHIDWTRPVTEVYNLIRGLSPYPAAWTYLVSAEEAEKSSDLTAHPGLKIYRAEKVINPEIPLGNTGSTPRINPPGTVSTDGKKYVHVACEEGWIALLEVQLAGKKRMPIDEFLRGFQHIDQYVCL